MGIAHFAFEFGARHKRRNRIDDDDIDCATADEDFRDFQRLLAAVRLRDEEVIHIDAELARVVGVQCVFRIHEYRRSAKLLGFGDGMQ